MPYCVKCGVELMGNAKRCPLCKTVVILPEGVDGEGEGLYPRCSAEGGREPFRPTVFGLAIYTLIMAIPLVITGMIDLRSHGQMTWSMYVVSSILLTWLLTTVPFWFRKQRFARVMTFGTMVLSLYLYLLDAHVAPVSWAGYAISAILLVWVYVGVPGFLPVRHRAVVAIFIDALVTLGYLWFIEWQTCSGPWWTSLGLPIVVLVASLLLVLAWLIEAGPMRDFAAVGGVILVFGIISFGVDLIVKRFLHQSATVGWSLVVLAASIPLAGIFFMVHNKVELQVLLKKKFHL